MPLKEKYICEINKIYYGVVSCGGNWNGVAAGFDVSEVSIGGLKGADIIPVCQIGSYFQLGVIL